MGNIHMQTSFKVIMPEILVFRNDEVLLVKGKENDRIFWWTPGAYWIREKSCDLQIEEPKQWIKRVLRSQIHVKLMNAFLRSVSFVAPNHAPVFVYQVDIEGKPKPNLKRDFLEIDFFKTDNLPEQLGRDEAHGTWLRGLLATDFVLSSC